MSHRLVVELAVVFLLACNPAAPSAVAASESPTHEGERCDATALADAAQHLDTADGGASSRAQRVAEAIRTHCPSVLATGLGASLDRVLDPERVASGFPTFAVPGDESHRACAAIDDVATAATHVARTDRPAAIYDGCDLRRFTGIVSRDEFIAGRVESGGVTMLALGEHLRRAGVPASTAATLTRELVLASGLP
jgi:hypothetical protein